MNASQGGRCLLMITRSPKLRLVSPSLQNRNLQTLQYYSASKCEATLAIEAAKVKRDEMQV